jgi:hypothetical protein
MSLDQFVFLDALPDRQGWQSAIDKLGIDLQLDPDLDLSRDKGFSPCKIRGASSGFELEVGRAAELLRDYPSLAPAIGSRSHVICLRWGGDLAECACVLGASLALVEAFGAVAYYPADDILYDAAKLKEEMLACLAEI